MNQRPALLPQVNLVCTWQVSANEQCVTAVDGGGGVVTLSLLADKEGARVPWEQ